MPASHYHTAADLLALPEDGNKYEVVHGELLVTPSPRMRHQAIVQRLSLLLGNYLERYPVAAVYPGGDVHFGVDSLVIPDLLVVDLESVRRDDWARINRPLLVIEILSASSDRQDRFTKRRLYQEMGIPHYWLVDAERRVVEVWTPEAAFPVTEHVQVRWQPEGAGEGLVVELGALFGEVLDG